MRWVRLEMKLFWFCRMPVLTSHIGRMRISLFSGRTLGCFDVLVLWVGLKVEFLGFCRMPVLASHIGGRQRLLGNGSRRIWLEMFV